MFVDDPTIVCSVMQIRNDNITARNQHNSLKGLFAKDTRCFKILQCLNCLYYMKCEQTIIIFSKFIFWTTKWQICISKTVHVSDFKFFEWVIRENIAQIFLCNAVNALYRYDSRKCFYKDCSKQNQVFTEIHIILSKLLRQN